MSLRIDLARGAVVVTLPIRASQRSGMALLRQHEAWLTHRLASLPERCVLGDGGAVPVDGMEVLIRREPSAPGARLEGNVLVVGGGAEFCGRRVTDFLKLEARRRFARIAHEKAASIGLRPSRVTVKDTRSRWGSCSPRGVLMFSWRLIMAPTEVQDYVVAHEVAHLRHLDHGPAFWALCETLSSHRCFASDWLAENGARLFRIG